jgi:hypothetical protein
MPLTLRRVVFVFAALATAAFLHGCDSAGPAVEEDPPAEKNPGGDPSGDAMSVSLQAETNRRGVQLSWETSGSGGADRFRIYRGTNADFDTTGAALTDTTETSLQDTGLDPSARYHYRVGAFEGDSALALSGEKKALAPPGKVSQLEGEGEFYRSALQWEEGDGASQGYHVYRSENSFSSASEATQITGSPVGDATFTDSTALDGVEYHYRVAAVGPEGHEGAFSPAATVVPSFEGDPLEGKEIFRESCAVCHASPQASGLKTFSFPDTTVHRRDLSHISEEESFDVIEFLRSGDAPRRESVHLGDPELPPFQPGGKILSSDKQFGIELFGEDEWPEDLTREELLKKRPTEQPLPFEMPEWSNESHKFDWIADRKVPESIRQDAAVTQALGQYRLDPTDENLVRLWREIQKVKPGGRNTLRSVKPSDVSSREEFAEVLEFNRWIASLVATHALRSRDENQAMQDLLGTDRTMGGDQAQGRRETPVKEIWAVGVLMQEALAAYIGDREKPPFPGLPYSYKTDNYRDDIGVALSKWMYVSWMHAIGSKTMNLRYPPVWVGHRHGHKRVAAYMVAYTAAAAPMEDSARPYVTLARFGDSTPERWQPELLPFVYDSILHYINQGNQLYGSCSKYDRHVKKVRKAADYVLSENPHFEGENREEIETKRDQIIGYIEDQKEKHQGSCS